MTKRIYSSPTGLYSIRLNSDLIHEGISAIEVSELLIKYKNNFVKQSEDPEAWPMNPDNMTVEEFSGTYILKKK